MPTRATARFAAKPPRERADCGLRSLPETLHQLFLCHSHQFSIFVASPYSAKGMALTTSISAGVVGKRKNSFPLPTTCNSPSFLLAVSF